MKPSELIAGLQILVRNTGADDRGDVTVFGSSGVMLTGPDKAPEGFSEEDRERLRALGWRYDGVFRCWWLKV